MVVWSTEELEQFVSELLANEISVLQQLYSLVWDPLYLSILTLGLHDLVLSRFTLLIALWKWGIWQAWMASDDSTPVKSPEKQNSNYQRKKSPSQVELLEKIYAGMLLPMKHSFVHPLL